MAVKVSFVVPAYNVERYIKKCLDSFKKIKSQDCEFIIVNDGSLDYTESISKEYEKCDNRFRVISQENKGVSSARNTGMKYALGKWICFWDGDDWITDGFGDYLIDNLEEEYDLLCFGMKRVISEDDSGLFWGGNEKRVIDKENINIIRKGLLHVDLPEYCKMCSKTFSFVPVWAKVYNLEILRKFDVLFDEKFGWGEDLFFNYQAMRYMDKIVCIPDEGYNYRAQLESAMHSYKPEKRSEMEKMVTTVFQDIDNNKESMWEEAYLLGIKQFLYALKIDICHCGNPQSYKMRKNTFYEFKNHFVFSKSFQNGKIKNFRFEVKMMALLAKYNMFFMLDLLLKSKEKIETKKIKKKEIVAV